MGMYDELIIHNKHLPDDLKGYESEWQTKSHDRLLDTLEITEQGRLQIRRADWGAGETIETPEFTGDIKFYNKINDKRVEFVARFEHGQMIELTRTK